MKKIINSIFLFFALLIIPFGVFAKDNEITLYLFHGDGCPHCAEEIEFLDSIEDKYDNLVIVKYEVWNNKENSDLLNKVEDAFDITRSGVPTTVIGDTVIKGYSEATAGKIERAINYYSKEEYEDEVEKIMQGTFVKEEKKTDEEFEKQEKKPNGKESEIRRARRKKNQNLKLESESETLEIWQFKK